MRFVTIGGSRIAGDYQLDPPEYGIADERSRASGIIQSMADSMLDAIEDAVPVSVEDEGGQFMAALQLRSRLRAAVQNAAIQAIKDVYHG
jgi:hypothetical protein